MAKAGEDYDVIPSLMDVLSEALESKGRKPKHVRYRVDISERQIRRYLSRESYPPAKDLESFVAAVAVEAGTDRLVLWRRALDDARASVKKKGRDPRLDAAAAVQAIPLLD